MSPDATLHLMPTLAKPAAGRTEYLSKIESGPVEALSELSNADSDASLLEALALGKKDALAILFRRHGRTILNVARRILRDDSEADDLRQEVFLFVFEKAKLFNAQKGSALSWLVQVTYHRAIDRRRYLVSRQHYTAVQFDEELSCQSALPSFAQDFDGRNILNRLKTELSEDQQQTLELHFFEGYSLREIAEKSGQSVGNVRHHYYRALDRLRMHLFPQKRRLE